jgi:hypothetical protein
METATRITPSALEADRFDAADLAAVMERLAGSPLAEEGRVCLIGLDAIRNRLGDRWAGRRAQVHEHVERTLARHLPIGGWFARVSEVDFVVVQPALSRYAAQASCLTYLRELMEHFLGMCAPADLRVREVTRLGPRGLEAQPLDPRAVAAVGVTGSKGAAPAETPASGDDWEALRAQNPFEAASGELLRVSCRLDPLFRLPEFVQVGYRLTRRVVDERTGATLSFEALSRLTTFDLEKIDLATIARGFSRLSSERAKASAPALVLPVNFPTLASQKARRALIACLKAARQATPVRVTCEISRLEGVPANALYSAVGMMKPFCDGVIGGVESPRRTASGLRGSGLAGIAFDYAGPSGEDPDRMLAALGPMIEAAHTVSPRVMVLGLKTPRELGLAAALRATHATLRR